MDLVLAQQLFGEWSSQALSAAIFFLIFIVIQLQLYAFPPHHAAILFAYLFTSCLSLSKWRF